MRSPTHLFSGGTYTEVKATKLAMKVKKIYVRSSDYFYSIRMEMGDLKNSEFLPVFGGGFNLP
jgi:hypothetical protein